MRRAEVEQENADILNELIEIKVRITISYAQMLNLLTYIHTYMLTTNMLS